MRSPPGSTPYIQSTTAFPVLFPPCPANAPRSHPQATSAIPRALLFPKTQGSPCKENPSKCNSILFRPSGESPEWPASAASGPDSTGRAPDRSTSLPCPEKYPPAPGQTAAIPLPCSAGYRRLRSRSTPPGAPRWETLRFSALFRESARPPRPYPRFRQESSGCSPPSPPLYSEIASPDAVCDIHLPRRYTAAPEDWSPWPQWSWTIARFRREVRPPAVQERWTCSVLGAEQFFS